MKSISIEKVVKPVYSSFCAVHYENKYFAAPLHIHPEYELILIEKGEGHAFVGDQVRPFKKGDFMLIGCNLPHLWLSADCYYEKDSTLMSQSTYSQFSSDIFPMNDSIEEFKNICQLLRKSARGILFLGERQREIQECFTQLPNLNGFNKLVMLYEILHDLSSCPYQFLTDKHYINPYIKDEEDNIIKRANQFMHLHYQEEITLEQIAAFAGMNPSALCRYYKKHTQKTMFSYLTEIRITYATKLLSIRQKNISQIAYDCGYNNISYFNRQFKALKGKTPSEYYKDLHHEQEETTD